MSYQALYRKYRSQNFDEVYGQEHIVRTLKNALNNNKIAHAYLFTGPRGTGKTSIARLLAKALNCEQGIGHICNECESCKLISTNAHPDIIEIDAASNSRVEEIRNVIEQVKYAPIKARYKVYIIDEVHMLSNSAFNALLKTLEEPPENVVFILATTEPYKVLPTIISRCQRFDFTKIDNEAIKSRLQDICKKENISIEDEALNELASLADGGMRDALSLLDEIIAYCGNNIKYSDILNIFGLISKEEKVNFLEGVFNKQINEVLNKFISYIQKGVDVKHFNEDLINILKDLLIYKITKDTINVKYINENLLIKLSNLITISDLKIIINKLIDANNEFKNIADLNSFYEIVLLDVATSKEINYEENKVILKQQENPIEKQLKENKNKLQEKIHANDTSTSIKKEIINEEKVQDNKQNIEDELNNLDKSNLEKSTQNSTNLFINETTQDNKIEENIPSLNEINREKLENKTENENEKLTSNLSHSKELEMANTYKPSDYKENIEQNKPNIAPDNDKKEIISLSDDLIIKAIVKSSKEEKVQLYEKWNLLDDYRIEPKFAPLISKIQTTTLFSLCDELLILQTQYNSVVETINQKQNNALVVELISKLLGRKVRIYAITLNEANRLTMYYYNLRQVNKLPKKSEIGKLF